MERGKKFNAWNRETLNFTLNFTVTSLLIVVIVHDKIIMGV